MEIKEDRWLSAIFQYPVFNVSVESNHKVQDGPLAISDLVRGHARKQDAALYFAKIQTEWVDLSQQLSAIGFYVVDVNVTFGIDVNAHNYPGKTNPSKYSISEIHPAQHEEVLAIAGSCFRYSRFHLDPLVPKNTADLIKREWIGNYIRKKRGERLWVASVDERPAGFLAVIASESLGKRIHTIDLIGVSQDFQKRGVGQALVAFFIDEYKTSSDVLQVGTQATNIPSMRLYQKAGFFIKQTQYVMHMHVRKDKA